MVNKRIDNHKKDFQNKTTIINNKLKNIENEIYDNKERKKKITELTEEFVNIDRKMNQCIKKFMTSIKGKEINSILNDMQNDSKNNLLKISGILDEEERIIKRNINDLYSAKTKLEKDKKKQIEKE